MSTTYLNEAGGASGGSPASLDYVNTQAVSSTNPSGGSMAGPLMLANQTADPAAPNGGSVVYAKGGQLYTQNSQGLIEAVSTGQASITAAVTVANTVTETALLALSIPASDPVAGAVYRMRGWGVYSTTGTPTLAVNSYYGGLTGTAIASVPAITTGSSLTNALFKIDAELVFYSTTKAQGFIQLMLGTSASTDAASGYVASPSATAGVTVAVTTAKAFTLSAVWGTASASNTLSLLGGYAERIA